MSSGAPSRTEHVYNQIRQRIESGELCQGDKLPSHLELASRFDVAPMTVRTALTRLEQDGLIVREHGRGTFVRGTGRATVLVVDDDPTSRRIVARYVGGCGLKAIEAPDPAAAREMLKADPSIGLILTDVYMPDKDSGLTFIRDAHRLWPEIPLAAVTGHANDLAELHGTSAQPLLVLSKPVRADRIEALLVLVLGSAVTQKTRAHESRPHGLALATDRLQQALSHAQRKGQVLAVLHIDVAPHEPLWPAELDPEHVIASAVRESDTLTRLSDSRFELVLHDMGSRDRVVTVGRKLLTTFLTRRVRAKVSIGIALFPFDGRDAPTLQGCADAALRLAQVHPDNRFEFFFREAPAI